MDGCGCVVDGSVQQTSSGAYVACASAKRTWEHFTLQAARLVSVPCKNRSDAEMLLERLVDDLNRTFGA